MWDDAGNARAYDDFARRYGMYDQTSAGLVDAAGLDPGASVVDLCCGTGRTTLAILAALGPPGRVVGVDQATAMLALAQRGVTDPRVTWLQSPAEELSLPASSDAVLCNSAIWQTDLPRTFAAVARTLRPGGRFAFNIGRRFLAGANTFEPTLGLTLREIAARRFQWRPPAEPQTPRRRPSADDIQQMLTAAGLDPDPPVEVSYHQEADEQRAWLSIPIFTERLLPGLDYAQRMAVLAEAPAPPSLRSDWTIFTATAT